MQLIRAIVCATALLVWMPSLASAQTAPGLAFSMKADPVDAMAEVLTQGFRNVYVSGSIETGDTERFLAFVRLKNLDVAKVVFDSPGGSLFEGMKLGSRSSLATKSVEPVSFA